MEWLQTNWVAIVGTIILVIGGFYIPGLRKIWIIGFKTLLSEKVLTKLFLEIVDKIVKSTKNKLDDAWLEELKKKLNDVK